MATPPPLGAPNANPKRPAQSSFPWVQTVGIVVAVAGVGAAVFAMAKRASRPEPPSTPLVTTSTQPKTVVVDLSQIAAPDPDRLASGGAATRPASDDDVPPDMTAAPGTGVIAVKTGGKTKVAKVAKVADKPLERNHDRPYDYDRSSAYRQPPRYQPPPQESGGPRVYGEPTPEEIAARERERERERNRPRRGVTYREATRNERDPLLPFSGQ